ncbi:hypothetical protein G6F50_017429 [Rhizopus delemar]|uniref:Uncharacterized protein n=1 Tax=Rhizopus delemar TaxID=936053 RepID=A0A9P6XQ04_9FUNG|nr:hypothetical protein G6F50_017429 [Rhizopus delemar]
MPHAIRHRLGCHVGSDAFGCLQCRIPRRRRHHHNELLSTHPKRLVLPPHAIAQRLCQQNQYLVANRMTKHIVDPLEMIQVQSDDRKGEPGCLQFQETQFKGAPVHKTSHWISHGLRVQAPDFVPMLRQCGDQGLT